MRGGGEYEKGGNKPLLNTWIRRVFFGYLNLQN